MKALSNTIFIIIFTINLTNAQDLPDYGCTPSHYRAHHTVEFFLTEADFEEERVATGTTGIPVAQIKHVENYNVCIKLDNVLNSNPKLKKIKEDTTSTLFYYQTDKFYFIFWKRLDLIGGVKRKFIVVNSSFVIVGEYFL